MRTLELATEIVHRQAASIAEHAPRITESGSDPEHIHQARVATRRLRAALNVFKTVLPANAQTLRDELKWIASHLGGVRDLDVQIRRLQSNAARLGLTQDVVAYGAWLDEQHEHAFNSLGEALRSSRFAALTANLEEVTPLPDWDEDVNDFAPKRLKKAARRLEKRADSLELSSSDTDFHQARIRAKRLRYSTEFFEPVYRKPARKLVTACADLQDLLGNHQDGIIAGQLIHQAIQTAAAAWPAPTSLALGQLVQSETQLRSELRGRFPKIYDDVEDAWRTLGRAL